MNKDYEKIFWHLSTSLNEARKALMMMGKLPAHEAKAKRLYAHNKKLQGAGKIIFDAMQVAKEKE